MPEDKKPETYKSIGRVVNRFKEASEHPERAVSKFIEQLEFAHENRTCGYTVMFNKVGHLDYGAANVPLSLVHEARQLEGQEVECEWEIEDKTRLTKVVNMQPVPVKA